MGQWCPLQVNSKVPKVGQTFTFIFHLLPPASLPDFQILSQVCSCGSDWSGGSGECDSGGLVGLAASVDLHPAGHPGPPTLPYSCLLTYNDRFKRPRSCTDYLYQVIFHRCSNWRIQKRSHLPLGWLACKFSQSQKRGLLWHFLRVTISNTTLQNSARHGFYFDFQGFVWFVQAADLKCTAVSAVGIRIDNVESHRWSFEIKAWFTFLKTGIFDLNTFCRDVGRTEEVFWSCHLTLDICWWIVLYFFLLIIGIEREQCCLGDGSHVIRLALEQIF